jgi:hypothetical protein
MDELEPIDLERFKKLRDQLNGSTADTMIVYQLIGIVDHLADVNVALVFNQKVLEFKLEAAENDLAELMKEKD